ncbi:MAG: alpha/beta hydrolase [Alphaproteobacteria bacterium]
MTRDHTPRYLKCKGETLACHVQPGNAPGIVFLGGFGSDMTGSKASFLSQFCQDRGRSYLRFDYSGHGQSSGQFIEGTIGRWLDDATAVFDHFTTGPQILVGSSMGGWLMILLALRRLDRVAGLIGIAAAPDFTEDLIWQTLSAADRHRLTQEGVIYAPSAYDSETTPLTLRLIEDGRRHLVLRQPIPFVGPVRLLHGTRDDDVPWQTSCRLAEAIVSTDVIVTLIKGGDHRLSSPANLDCLGARVDEVLAALSIG